MRTLCVLLGLAVLIATTGSILRNLIVPRGLASILVRTLWRVNRTLLARPFRTYRARDRALAWLAPVVLVSTLAFWLGALFAGFGLLLYGLSDLNLPTALREAGSSLFTLGFASSDRARLSMVDFFAAASGPVVVALQIAYLPSLYGAYNRRETEVTLLEVRAGAPAWGPELLARQGLVGTVDQLRSLYAAWERLAADVGESHANYPVLLSFRSPQYNRSWIVAMIAVMDAAAMHLALAPGSAPAEARLMLRAGFSAMREIARVVRIPFDTDPKPEDTIQLTRDEFAEGAARVRQAGFRTERDDDEAWPHFAGWRVNYEAIAYELARRVDAVPAPWTGPRDWTGRSMPPVRPPHRRPDAPGVIYPGETAPNDAA
jgi:hypothetical protein